MGLVDKKTCPRPFFVPPFTTTKHYSSQRETRDDSRITKKNAVAKHHLFARIWSNYFVQNCAKYLYVDWAGLEARPRPRPSVKSFQTLSLSLWARRDVLDGKSRPQLCRVGILFAFCPKAMKGLSFNTTKFKFWVENNTSHSLYRAWPVALKESFSSQTDRQTDVETRWKAPPVYLGKPCAERASWERLE